MGMSNLAEPIEPFTWMPLVDCEVDGQRCSKDETYSKLSDIGFEWIYQRECGRDQTCSGKEHEGTSGGLVHG